MESRNKLTMCRLCLCENECFINIFERNDWQGYVAAEVISDLIQFQVSRSDGYPHVVCSKCLTKLTDFKQFKECCQKSKKTYAVMYISSDRLLKHKPEMGNIKSEELIIDSSSYEIFEDPPNTTEVSCGPILLKYEVLPFSRDGHQQAEPTHIETVTHPKHTVCLENKRPFSTSKGEGDADPCTWSINNPSIFDKSKNISLSADLEASTSGSMEILEEQKILSGERKYVASLIQQDIRIENEVEKKTVKVKDVKEGNRKRWRRSGQENGAREGKEGLKCFHCGVVLMSKHALVQHMKGHGFVNSYDCAVCGKIFRFNCELKRHVLSHAESKPYKCGECGNSFRRDGNLKEHMKLHMGSKRFKCVECSKSFSNNGNLKTHMRSHTGSKPYKCAQCGKSFGHNSNLKRHIMSHTGNRPYKCAECSKRFRNNSDLKIHMRTHTGSKPYECSQCSKRFSKNGDLKRHIGTHTGSKPYKCSDCSKYFSQNSDLKKHMVKHKFQTL